jgi:hypothetical protein
MDGVLYRGGTVGEAVASVDVAVLVLDAVGRVGIKLAAIEIKIVFAVLAEI